MNSLTIMIIELTELKWLDNTQSNFIKGRTTLFVVIHSLKIAIIIKMPTEKTTLDFISVSLTQKIIALV